MRENSTLICGHRGGGGDPESVKVLTMGADWSQLGRNPDHYDYRNLWENRLKTFIYMIGAGVTCFELDLLPSKDGDAIVIHNSEIHGKKIWEYGTAELRDKGWSTLDELLTAIENTRTEVTLLLEVKGSVSSELATDTGDKGTNETSARLIDRVLAIISKGIKHGWTYKQLPLIGFNHAMLAMARQKNPEICIGLSYAMESFKTSHPRAGSLSQDSRLRGNDNTSIFITHMINEARDAGAYAINPDERLVTKELVKAAHEAGLKVQPWTSYREKPRTEDMIRFGVDTLITDCPLEAITRFSQSAT